jgi:uncharacterized protein YdeI (YjbR/CyaY-like superfamily)
MKKQLSAGVAHRVPPDLRTMLATNPKAHAIWEDITPLARNEWICWIEEAKKLETRVGRIKRARENLTDGKRRPCCWAGCKHR